MKRALLIAGGTVGGLGAVLSITPPQLSASSTSSIGALGGSTTGAVTAEAAAVTTTAASTPEASATPKASKSATASAAPKATTSAVPTASATPTPTPTPSKTATTSGSSGTFTGASYPAARFGNVTVVATFANGKITNVSASQSPSSWSQYSLSALIPYVNSGKITVEQIKQYSAQTLPCAIDNRCASGQSAKFTATAFWQSFKSAISKANL